MFMSLLALNTFPESRKQTHPRKAVNTLNLFHFRGITDLVRECAAVDVCTLFVLLAHAQCLRGAWPCALCLPYISWLNRL